MKVLIFTNHSKIYNQEKAHHYHGTGWVDSQILFLVKRKEVELAITFFNPQVKPKEKKENIVFYPIYKPPRSKNRIWTIWNDWNGNLESDEYLQRSLEAIKDFKPDIIQVFGTEGLFASMQKFTKVPVVVHIQGLLNPYYHCYYPVGHSKYNFFFNLDFLSKNLLGTNIPFSALRLKKAAKREADSLKSLKYVTGRTIWDKKVTRILNRDIKYFHQDEILREVFYRQEYKRKSKIDSRGLRIVSTVSNTVYKGIDVVLKTAKLLKEVGQIDFHWSIIGVKKDERMLRHFEKSTRIKHGDQNIEVLGILNPSQLTDVLSSSDVYVHPSYIDNSPNSICEAQIMGLPVVATNVGGVSSLVRHNTTGVLVPANGIFEIVYHLIEMFNHPLFYYELGANARNEALKRNDASKIVNMILANYNSIIKLNKTQSS